MNRYRALFMVCFVAAAAAIAVYAAESVGNPRPGYPHDTIIVHVMKADSGPKECDGGHALFLRHVNGDVQDAQIYVTMTDWVQINNDSESGDTLFDEDPVDTVDNDGDGLFDEDPMEPGGVTTALDCDAWGDGVVRLQIRDANPAKGVISTQEWFARMIGKPGENFSVTSSAMTVTCLATDPDGVPASGDETIACEPGDWVELADINLKMLPENCVKTLKTGGKGGGKTPFCNITDGFMVDVDSNGDGIADSTEPQFVFSVSCLDNPLTTGVDESLYCPLSSILWEVDPADTTSQAKAQIFVAHTGRATIQSGRVK